MSMTRLCFFLLLGLVPGLVQARGFRILGPDDLLPDSSLVCNGVVVKLDKMGEESEPGGSLWSEMRWKAHVKGLAAFKGTMPPEFDFLYTEKFYPVNGPMEFRLVEGQRYRFFLNPAPAGPGYISVLETNMDNVWSVEMLRASEPDSSPPLLREEAIRLALAYFKLKQPPIAKDQVPEERAQRTMSGDVDPNIWRVQFWFKKGSVQNFTPDAEVLVLGDRAIAADSWIASGPAMPAGEIKAGDIGKSCWIRVKPTNKDRPYGNMDLRGTIKGVTRAAIILSDAHDMWRTYQCATLPVEKEDVLAIQTLVPSS